MDLLKIDSDLQIFVAFVTSLPAVRQVSFVAKWVTEDTTEHNEHKGYFAGLRAKVERCLATIYGR